MNTVGLVLLSQLAGPAMMFDKISCHTLTVTGIEVRPREMTDEWYDNYSLGEEVELPHRLIIDGSAGERGLFHIGINLEKHVIESADWSVLLGQEPSASGDLGVIIFGLPSIILSSPFWLAHNSLMDLSKPLTGMDHHTFALYLKLKDQLPSEVQEDFRRALLNHCNGVEEAYLKAWAGRHRRQERKQMERNPELRKFFGA